MGIHLGGFSQRNEEEPSVKQKIIHAYEKLADRYNALIDHKPHNAYYDRPNTLGLLPEVKGKAILDAACGPGKYAEILLEQGASVTGFDISPQMIQLAQQRNEGRGTFLVHDLCSPLEMFESESFDIVICALALQYVKNWTTVIQEFYRVLIPRGKLIVSIEHPIFQYNYFHSTQYFDIEHVASDWKGFGIPVKVHSYRRSLTDCLLPLTNNGFYIDKLVEPLPTKEFEAIDPRRYKKLMKFPSFLCIRAEKRP
ncbi:MAG: methyltransferase domain-containing protein [Bacteroidota bacterium]